MPSNHKLTIGAMEKTMQLSTKELTDTLKVALKKMDEYEQDNINEKIDIAVEKFKNKRAQFSENSAIELVAKLGGYLCQR